MTNSWILCHGKPSLNEVLLAQAMARTQAKPTILVVDDPQEYPSLRGNPCRKLWEASISINLISSDTNERVNCINMDQHCKVGCTFWMNGTHFIFSGQYRNFKAHLLGPHGHICLNGGCNDPTNPRGTGGIIRDAITSIKPCLLFDNTGAESQMYARLITKISHIDRELQKALEAQNTREDSKWFRLQYVNETDHDDGTGKDGYYEKLLVVLQKKGWELCAFANKGQLNIETEAGQSKQLSMAHVLQIIDLYCSNPGIFSSIIVPVDPLSQSPDSIVNALTLSTARSNLESREVGAGYADENAVENAWRIHHQLQHSRKAKELGRTVLYVVYIVASFFTTLTSIILIVTKNADHIGTLFTLLLPAIVALSSGILNLTAADTKLIKIRAAQAKIMFHIFQFRLRVGKYSLNAYERGEEAEAGTNGKDGAEGTVAHHRFRDNPSANVSTALNESRKEFSNSIQKILHDLLTVDLNFDELSHGTLSQIDRTRLRTHVAMTLNLENQSYNLCIMSSLMILGDYYKLRVSPLLVRLEKKECTLRIQTRSLQILCMILTTLATIIGAAGISPKQPEWLGGQQIEHYIPIVVAAATGTFQFLKVYDLERRFEVVSAAARELRALDTWWKSSSDLDKNVRTSTVYLVRTCEQLALQYETDSVIQVNDALLQPDSRKAKSI